MIKYIHCSRSIPGKLSLLRRSGKQGEFAADQFNYLIHALRQGCMLESRVYCRRTKNGEKRIRNCIKYDLGNGYRLVTVLKGNRLFIPFIGGHDETGTWIDRHKHDIFSKDDPSYDCEQVVCLEEENSDQEELYPLEEERDIYEEHIRALLDESTLKEIFQGLYR
ncbi:hypothetical protein [Desulfopila sp. IMCC35008]|uniref:hypothetical protein n=1 Tax=Desulfopila sp. IMCC35008 TaxID=2653858 RepID=UPI0013D34CC3|nr:hypothetical protein [Desulfopila sp. IMCC35008]